MEIVGNKFSRLYMTPLHGTAALTCDMRCQVSVLHAVQCTVDLQTPGESCPACMANPQHCLLLLLTITPPRLHGGVMSSLVLSFCRTVSRITHDRGHGRRPNMVDMVNWVTPQKRLTFGGDAVTDTDSASLFR